MKGEINRILEILEGTKDENGCIPMALVRRAFKKPEQRWIPVEEELPENGKEVLVTRHYLGEEDNNKSCYYTEVAARYGDDDNPDWISYSDEYKMHPKNHIVIAWQELPEPYKGENE